MVDIQEENVTEKAKVIKPLGSCERARQFESDRDFRAASPLPLGMGIGAAYKKRYNIK